MKRSCLAVALAALTPLAASAQDGFAMPISAQVLHGWVQADGTRMAAVHMSLEPGWKTYWRAPGDAGIPPGFDWSGSRNLDTVSVSWPTPQVFDENGMRSIGYSGELVIPLTLAPKNPGAPLHLQLTMDIGICADICIPHQLSFDETLDSSETRPTPAIAAALAQTPLSAREAGVTASRCRLEPTRDGLQIEARITVPPTGRGEVVVIEPGIAGVWVSETDTRRSGGDVIAISQMVQIDGGPIALDRSAIRLTVLGSRHAVDVRGCDRG